MIKSGLQRVTLEIQKSPARAQFSAQLDWVFVVRCKARRLRSSGREQMRKSGVVSSRDEVFEIRFYSGIHEGMRVLESGKIYNIDYVENVGDKNRKLLLECSYVSNRENRGA